MEQGIPVPDEKVNHKTPTDSPIHKEEPTVQQDKADGKAVNTDANKEIYRY